MKKKTATNNRVLIQFYITPTQRKKLTAAARRKEKSRSELIRDALRGAL